MSTAYSAKDTLPDSEPDNGPTIRFAAESRQITVSELIRLRWLAILGQGLAVAAAAIAGMDLPFHLMFTFVSIMILSNLAVHSSALLKYRFGNITLASTILLDVSLLTCMLYWSGGPHNPFTSFYLLQLVVAALILDSTLAWLITFVCICSFSALFLSSHPLPMPFTHIGQITFNLHMEGMFVAFALTGICVTYFVTKLRLALQATEEELNASRSQAQRAQRLASLATLAAGAAHELATPLATISLITQELEVPHNDGPISRLSADTRMIREQVQRCQTILNKMNRTSTDDIGEPPRGISLQELLSKVIINLRSDQVNRVEVRNEVVELMLFIPSDSVIQAIATLIANACEAEGSNGPVRLRVSRHLDDVCFAVIDKGVGIPPDSLARLGEPFYTTKEPGRGMGLGLFLVRTLAERLGGALEIRSEMGRGSCFTLRIKVRPQFPDVPSLRTSHMT